MSALRVTEKDLRPFFTVKGLCRYLSISERSLYSMLASGELPSYKVAGSRRIDPTDVEKYLAKHRNTD